MSTWRGNATPVLTRDGEVDPGPVRIRVVRSFDEDHRTFVPSLVLRAHVADLDGRVVEETDASLVVDVDVRRQPVELDEDGHLDPLFLPFDHVFDVLAARVVDVALEDRTAADVCRLPDGPTLDAVLLLLLLLRLLLLLLSRPLFVPE